MTQAEAAPKAIAFLRARLAVLPFPGLGLPALRPRLAQARYRKRAGWRPWRRWRRACDRPRRRSSPPSTPLLQRVPPQDVHRRRQLLRPRPARRWTARRWSASSPAMAMSAPARCASRAISRLRGGIVDLWPPGEEAAAAAGFLRRDPGRHPPLRCRDPIVRQDSGGRRSRCCPPAKRR